MNEAKQVLIIAEIGNTHEGSVGLAKCFIEAAAKCGVNAVKFQTHIFDAESLPDAPNPPYFKDETRKQYLERTAFRLDQWKEIKRFAEEEWGIEFFSSCFSLEAVDLLEAVGVETYKIPSGEVTNTPLLIKVAKTGKKVFLSSGMSNWQELDEAVKALKDHGNHDLTLFQCTSQYPCPPEAAGINVIHEMRERYGLPIGFSDHTRGPGIAIAAVATGACAVEKHFALSRRMYGPDARFSATPREFRAMVKGIRAVEKTMSTKVDKDAFQPSLVEMKGVFEKSIVAACDIQAGTVIEERHLAFKKPGVGIPAKEFQRILGTRLLQKVSMNTRLEWNMIATIEEKERDVQLP
jgi:sialic acid synthase SpsE